MYLFLPIAFVFCVLRKVKVTVTALKPCYFPDGSVGDRDTPCKASSRGQASACCAWFDICLDNSLCLSQVDNEVVTRGTCTDQKWQNDQCTKYCQDGMFSTIRCAKHEMSCSLAPLRLVMELVGISFD